MTDDFNPILESAKEHFAAQELKEIAVPEWPVDDKPLLIYAMAVTLEDRRIVQRKNRDNPLGAMVDLVIRKARNADGERIFKPIHKKELMNKVDPEVVSRIAEEMVGEPLEDEETGEPLDAAERARKNSKTIPSSQT